MSSFINVSNRLPITIGKQIKKSPGGLVSALDSVREKYSFSWIGWTGNVIADPKRQAQLDRQLQEQYNYQPVFLDRKDLAGYYSGFSNSSLWPILHYMPNFSRHNKKWFDIYEQVNKKFAQATLDNLQDDQMVWVHDYHLMLLPKMIRDLCPDVKIGFFLHTPFPSYEIFRCHPQREKLLKGLLGADLIGFHTYGYLRHFRSSVLRILDIESDTNHIMFGNHTTQIGVFPIGINATGFMEGLQSKECQKHQKVITRAYENKKIVLSVDRLDYTKGIPQRLNAIEHFLEKRKNANDVTFIFVCVPTRDDVLEYQDLMQNVQKRISEINGKYATVTNTPIHFLHKSVPFPQLCALYQLADAALVTPLIDGMNLVAKEYIACRQDHSGVLILSEFAGAAHELFNAQIVNPYNTEEVCHAIEEALFMPEAGRKDAMSDMRNRVLKYDARHWATAFLENLSENNIPHSNVPNEKGIPLQTVDVFDNAESIGLFLDYDGTLCEIHKRPQDAYPHEEIINLFHTLSGIENLDVYIISGRKRNDMDNWFTGFPFTLIAEHGYYYKTSADDDWQIMDPRAELTWKEQVIEIFQHFTDTTPGSAIEGKTSSIVWHYRQADPEFGKWKAQQLIGELYEVLSNIPVEIHHGKKIIEVSSTQINKGMAVEHFLMEKSYDTILCAGDDETDEAMFKLSHDDTISVKIGAGDTLANYKIHSPKAFRDYLATTLSQVKTQRQK